MFVVFTAGLAVFLDLDAIGIVTLVFHRRVVAAFALAASKRDDDSVVFLGHDIFLCALIGPLLRKRRQKKLPPEVAEDQYIQP